MLDLLAIVVDQSVAFHESNVMGNNKTSALSNQVAASGQNNTTVVESSDNDVLFSDPQKFGYCVF